LNNIITITVTQIECNVTASSNTVNLSMQLIYLKIQV